jgi:hypothetical protein
MGVSRLLHRGMLLLVEPLLLETLRPSECGQELFNDVDMPAVCLC